MSGEITCFQQLRGLPRDVRVDDLPTVVAILLLAVDHPALGIRDLLDDVGRAVGALGGQGGVGRGHVQWRGDLGAQGDAGNGGVHRGVLDAHLDGGVGDVVLADLQRELCEHDVDRVPGRRPQIDVAAVAVRLRIGDAPAGVVPAGQFHR